MEDIIWTEKGRQPFPSYPIPLLTLLLPLLNYHPDSSFPLLTPCHSRCSFNYTSHSTPHPSSPSSHTPTFSPPIYSLLTLLLLASLHFTPLLPTCTIQTLQPSFPCSLQLYHCIIYAICRRCHNSQPYDHRLINTDTMLERELGATEPTSTLSVLDAFEMVCFKGAWLPSVWSKWMNQ